MKKAWKVPSILEVSSLPDALGDCVAGTTPGGVEGGCHDGEATTLTWCNPGSAQVEPEGCHTGGQAGMNRCIVGDLVHIWLACSVGEGVVGTTCFEGAGPSPSGPG